ncbi:MAG: DUF6265 family protein, partial [Bacteroidota bacterium]
MNKTTLFAILAFCFFVVQCNTKEQTADGANSDEPAKTEQTDPPQTKAFEETDNPNVRVKTKFPEQLKGAENLLGTWTYTKKGRVHEETWSVKANGLPEGIAQQKEAGKVIFEENFSIEIKDQNVVLWVK